MRIDLVTIFPEYFAVLDVSLIGKASKSGLIELRIRDLRDETGDRHRTVDDTPYGGGAGMVMKPEPWGRMLDRILDEAGDADPLVLFPSPAGSVFTQRMARDFAGEDHIVICCGRYEGIDQRVIDFAAERARTASVSIGDYVLNGGEVAALAMVEAVARLVPGVVGNPDSLVEESHEDGLLEYPNYTKPARWRGRDVPAVLLSGNHAAIRAWRDQQRIARTRAVRPDLLPPADDGSLPDRHTDDGTLER